MRWIALLLLIVNAGLVGWQLAGTPGGPTSEYQPPEEIGRLALLREPAEATATSTARAAEPEPEPVCFSIGPFGDADASAAAGERLADLGLDPTERVLVDEETTGYQVLLPPHDSYTDAVETTRELSERGIQDYFIVSDDQALRNAVSLGVFSERSYALAHMAHIEELGFTPDLRVRTRERERYWLDYRDAGSVVRAEEIEAWVGEGPLQRLPRDC